MNLKPVSTSNFSTEIAENSAYIMIERNKKRNLFKAQMSSDQTWPFQIYWQQKKNIRTNLNKPYGIEWEPFRLFLDLNNESALYRIVIIVIEYIIMMWNWAEKKTHTNVQWIPNRIKAYSKQYEFICFHYRTIEFVIWFFTLIQMVKKRELLYQSYVDSVSGFNASIS